MDHVLRDGWTDGSKLHFEILFSSRNKQDVESMLRFCLINLSLCSSFVAVLVSKKYAELCTFSLQKNESLPIDVSGNRITSSQSKLCIIFYAYPSVSLKKGKFC